MSTRKDTLRQRARRRLRAAASDIRGVALQTVIVIVVLLVIAGSVSAVLLSRSSDVVSELESASIGGLTRETCVITSIGGVTGKLAKTPGALVSEGSNSDGTHCVWPDAVKTKITAAQCFAGSGGKLDKAAAGNTLGPTYTATDNTICAAELPT